MPDSFGCTAQRRNCLLGAEVDGDDPRAAGPMTLGGTARTARITGGHCGVCHAMTMQPVNVQKSHKPFRVCELIDLFADS